MTGFRNEKEMWVSQKPSLAGRWDRYELMTPAGHPDVKGSHSFHIHYIENKVGDSHNLAALEESQKEYLDWLLQCGQNVWLCFGGTKEKSLWFYKLKAFVPLFDPMNTLSMVPTVPHFWSGKQWLMPGSQGEASVRYCGEKLKNSASIDTRLKSKRP